MGRIARAPAYANGGRDGPGWTASPVNLGNEPVSDLWIAARLCDVRSAHFRGQTTDFGLTACQPVSIFDPDWHRVGEPFRETAKSNLFDASGADRKRRTSVDFD